MTNCFSTVCVLLMLSCCTVLASFCRTNADCRNRHIHQLGLKYYCKICQIGFLKIGHCEIGRPSGKSHTTGTLSTKKAHRHTTAKPRNHVTHSVASTPKPTPHGKQSVLFTAKPTIHVTQGNALPDVKCPTCDQTLNCVWNTTCYPTESCMIRSYPGFAFTTHCTRKEDCKFMKSVLKVGEIYCCSDKQCLQKYLGI